MVVSKSWHASHRNAVSYYEIELAVRPFLGNVSQLRDWRIEVGFEPIFAAAVKSMASGTVLLEVGLSGFQILRRRTDRGGVLVCMAAKPTGRAVTRKGAPD